MDGLKTHRMKMDKNTHLGDRTPRLKDFLIVILAVAVLIGFSWIAYYKLGWFH